MLLIMRPAERLRQRPRIAVYLEQRIVAAIGISLQNAGEGLQVALGMLLSSISRSIVESRRRRLPAERPVIPDIGPDATRIGLSLRQDRHCGVVTMQPLGSQDVRFDQRMDRLQRRGASADLICQRRQAEVDTLSGIALAGSAVDAGRTSQTGSSPEGWARQSPAASHGKELVAG
uniref:Uncharacterized protein n=1 Tax=Rhizobium leguminosarum TaxID=384 RepID=A0A179BZ74_RHILE|nr:hypothetical protein A4U53_37360 [Rhizobium leguminosarum]